MQGNSAKQRQHIHNIPFITQPGPLSAADHGPKHCLMPLHVSAALQREMQLAYSCQHSCPGRHQSILYTIIIISYFVYNFYTVDPRLW
jgi:hypothetical protein